MSAIVILSKCNFVNWMIQLQSEAKKIKVWKWLCGDPKTVNGDDANEMIDMEKAKNLIYSSVSEMDAGILRQNYNYPFEMAAYLENKYGLQKHRVRDETNVMNEIRYFGWLTENVHLELARFIYLLTDQIVQNGPISDEEQVLYFAQGPKGYRSNDIRLLYATRHWSSLMEFMDSLQKLFEIHDRVKIVRDIKMQQISSTQKIGQPEPEMDNNTTPVVEEALPSLEGASKQKNDTNHSKKRKMDTMVSDGQSQIDGSHIRFPGSEAKTNTVTTRSQVGKRTTSGKFLPQTLGALKFKHCSKCCFFLVSEQAPYHISNGPVEEFLSRAGRLENSTFPKNVTIVYGIGSMNQTFDASDKKIAFEACLYMPHMPVSVFSIPAAQYSGYVVKVKQNVLRVYWKGVVYASATIINGSYYLSVPCMHGFSDRKKCCSKTREMAKFVESTGPRNANFGTYVSDV